MSIKLISHHGINVLLVDYSQCKNKQEMLIVLAQVKEFYQKSSEGIRYLCDFNNAFGSIDFMAELKKINKNFGHKTIKGAVIGISGLTYILLRGFNMVSTKTILAFDTKNEALEYLIKD